MPELVLHPLSDPLVHIVIRVSLALLFFNAALHKTRYFQQYCADIRAYKLLPDVCAPLMAMVFASLEWLLVFSLPLLNLTFPLLLAAALLGLYAMAVAINLLRGRRHIDCGCYGPLKTHKNMQSSTITPYLVVRNILLASVALLCLTPGVYQQSASRNLIWLDLVVLPLCLASLIILYQAIELFFSQRETIRQFHQGTTVDTVQ